MSKVKRVEVVVQWQVMTPKWVGSPTLHHRVPPKVKVKILLIKTIYRVHEKFRKYIERNLLQISLGNR